MSPRPALALLLLAAGCAGTPAAPGFPYHRSYGGEVGDVELCPQPDGSVRFYIQTVVGPTAHTCEASGAGRIEGGRLVHGEGRDRITLSFEGETLRVKAADDTRHCGSSAWLSGPYRGRTPPREPDCTPP